MAAQFLPAWNFLMELEGGDLMHKVQGDPGGRTRFGIAENMNPQMWPGGRAPTETEAKRFYEAQYWYPLRLNQIQDQGIAEEIFEFAVNATSGGSGRNRAILAAQQATNAVRHAMGWEPIRPDGYVGPKTISALNALVSQGRVHVLAWDGAFNIEQLKYYRELRPALVARFLKGWTRRVIL